MENIGGVDVLQAAEELVEEELVVLGREVIVGLDDLVEVGLHELEDDVNVAELAARWREHDMLDLDDVRVAQEAEQLDLAEDAGGVRDVLEDVVDLLDGDVLAGEGVEGGGDHAVAALADHLGDLVPAGLAVVREERRLPGALATPRRTRRSPSNPHSESGYALTEEHIAKEGDFGASPHLLVAHGVTCVAPVPIRRDAHLALGGVALARGVNRPAAGDDGEGGGRGGGAGAMWIGPFYVRRGSSGEARKWATDARPRRARGARAAREHCGSAMARRDGAPSPTHQKEGRKPKQIKRPRRFNGCSW